LESVLRAEILEILLLLRSIYIPLRLVNLPIALKADISEMLFYPKPILRY